MDPDWKSKAIAIVNLPSNHCMSESIAGQLSV
jgi:hypothetical protein